MGVYTVIYNVMKKLRAFGILSFNHPYTIYHSIMLRSLEIIFTVELFFFNFLLSI